MDQCFEMFKEHNESLCDAVAFSTHFKRSFVEVHEAPVRYGRCNLHIQLNHSLAQVISSLTASLR